VSEASIVRFAQLLGYKGYKELKAEISTSLKNQISPTERFQRAVTEKEKIPDVLKFVAQNVINNIYDTVDSINTKEFSNVVDAIIRAQQVYCMGLEVSYHFARLMSFLLRNYAYNAHYLSMDFLHFQEQIAYLSKDDLLIAFSFSPYSRETVEAVTFAKKQKIPVVAFTDKKVAPIRQHATHCIQIKTDNITFTNSLGAVVVVMNAIITELNFRDKERTLNALKIIEETISNKRYFIAE
jgi:DNA-binding MurR/RpiR family transcriptional regulator